MVRALGHRGPDGEGAWAAGPIAFGHRRLAIRDLSDAARQPMQDPSGRITVTYNGEIYNYGELRREIERDTGYCFRTTSDTELLPAGYLAWGDRLFDRLEGMFAIGLWDAATKRLVLARDGVGIKPLYVHHGPDAVFFASEVKGLLADPAVPRRIAPDNLRRLLAQGYVSPTASLLQSIEQIPPGTVRTIDMNGTRDRRFWQPHREPDIRNLADAVEGFVVLFRAVAESMLVGDVPVGLLQSGGIDSSLVAFSLRSHQLPSFTATFREQTHDESELALQVSCVAGHTPHLISVEEQTNPVADFIAIARQFDGQLADSSGYAVYVLSRAIRQHVPVVLSGDGADEFFGGYTTYRASRLAAAISVILPAALAGAVGSQLLATGGLDERRLPPRELLGRFLAGLAAPQGHHAEWRRLSPRSMLLELFGPDLRELDSQDELSHYRAALTSGTGALVDRCLLADQRYYLPADMLMKVDAMSMAHGLEVRLPFLDRRIMDFAARLDVRLLCPLRGPDKLVLRRALERIGGPQTVVRAPKRGFNVPVASLLRGPLRSLGDECLARDVTLPPSLLDPGAVRRAWRAHRDRERNAAYLIWALLSLAVWCKTVGIR
jgi:asparagine synthase (glutamine-hydrolysing)